MPLSLIRPFWIAVMAACVASPLAAAKTKTMQEASAVMLAQACTGCHGPDGVSAGPAIPSIAGLPREYFVETMLAFKLRHLPATIMDRIAKGYSRDDFERLADHYAAMPFTPARQPFDPLLAKKGAGLHKEYCESCHEQGGSSREDEDIAVLAGQLKPYLRWTLNDMKRGKRETTRKMRDKLRRLLKAEGNAGLDALVHYYASQQGVDNQ